MLLVLVLSNLIGLSLGRIEGFMVGGQYANVSDPNSQNRDFSYTAFLNVQCLSLIEKPTVSWRCGASIVNEYLVLTAAHCVDSKTCDDISITVTVGDPDRLKGLVSSALSYIVHENYNSEFGGDIALVRLKSPLTFNARVSRVALMQFPPYEEEADIAGWGRIHPTMDTLTNILKHTKLKVLRKYACMELMEETLKGTFCATSNDTSYLLNGDSGSALVVRGYIQIGICSFIKPKISRTVAIFTDIGFYYNWIKKNAITIMCEDEVLETK